jgi:hypothetical protein
LRYQIVLVLIDKSRKRLGVKLTSRNTQAFSELLG